MAQSCGQSQGGIFGQVRERAGEFTQIRFANEALYQLSYTPNFPAAQTPKSGLWQVG